MSIPTGFIRDRRHARAVEGWAKRNPADPRHPAVMYELLTFNWCDHSEPLLSDHARLEVAYAFQRGRALDPDQAVPGCSCEVCTGIPADSPDRPKNGPRGWRRTAAGGPGKGRGTPESDLPSLPVEAARAVPIMDVAARLGIEHKRGWALCFNHADRSPSLHLNPAKNRAYCNPCSRSWDPIGLMMELRNIPFPAAVQELTYAETR